MSETTLVLLVVQFLVAAILWIGTARPFRDAVPDPVVQHPWFAAWAREPTRLVLPLLMVVAGLLFFSESLAPVWGPALGLEALGGLPDPVGRWGFVVLNLGVVGFLVGVTGGVWRSPFLPVVVLFPALVWLAGIPLFEVGLAGVIALGLILGGIREEDRIGRERAKSAGRASATRGPSSLSAGQALVGVLSIVLLGVTGWLA